MSSILIVIALLVGIGLVAGRKTVWRIFTALGAQFNKLGRAIWGYDPVAVYQKQVDDAIEEIKQKKANLASYVAHINELKRQVETAQREIAVLQTRAEGFVSQGNDAQASRCLGEKKTLETRLEQNRTSLVSYQAKYENSKQRMEYAQQLVVDAKRKAKQLKVDLRISADEAELAKLDSNLNTNNLEGLGEIEEEVQRQIDANRAVAQVNQDLGDTNLLDYQAEQSQRQLEANKELAELKAKMGITTRNGA